jgi:hypothetical protein
MRSLVAAVIAVVGSLAIINASALTARAAITSGTATGNDVSYPQCGKTLPTQQAFGIVGVNAGLANTTNPCLATEIIWAENSSGVTRQPRTSLFVNTADPGKRGVADWPVNNYDPVSGRRVHDPYGSCTGENNAACAWQYGWNLADLDAQTRGVPDPGSYRWWLDVETINSWESNTQNNRADLEGMAAYFRSIGAAVGIYSTARQWGPLVGPIRPSSSLYRLPDWIPGAKTLSKARANCRLAPLTKGGIVTITQWTASPINNDFSCP